MCGYGGHRTSWQYADGSTHLLFFPQVLGWMLAADGTRVVVQAERAPGKQGEITLAAVGPDSTRTAREIISALDALTTSPSPLPPPAVRVPNTLRLHADFYLARLPGILRFAHCV